MKKLSIQGRELAPYTPTSRTDTDQAGAISRNERGPLAWSGSVAEPMESTNRPLRLSDFVELAGETLRFMQREKTGVSVVVLPVLIVAIKIALLWKGGPAAVELAQVELWALWAWSVLRIVF